jgi:hypothetical protein
MERYGITNVPIDSFHYREYRYTNLNDAIAQAERDQLGSARREHAAGLRPNAEG